MTRPRFQQRKAEAGQLYRYEVLVPNPTTPGATLSVGWVASRRFSWPGYRAGRLRWVAYTYHARLPGGGAFVETASHRLATYRTRQRAAEALVRATGMASTLQEG